MKNNYTKILLLLLIILFFCTKIYAINDTIINVHLEKSQNDSIIGVELSFYNNSNDTIFLFSRFEHFLYEMETKSGFMIVFHVNGKQGIPLWGETPKTNYVFSKGFVLITPNCKVNFNIPLNDYLLKINPKNKYDIQFIVNYFYKKQNSSRVESILNKKTNILRLNDEEIDSTETGTEGDTRQKKVVLTEIETLKGNIDTSQLSATSPVTVRFFRGEGKYAMDEGTDSRYKRSVMLSKYYEPFGTGYIAPWKLIPTGKNDVVEAYAVESGTPFERGRLRFALKDGTEIPAKDEGGKWLLTLPGTGSGETYEVFALYETGKDKYATAGKLNVVSYPEQRHTVTLVEVDGQMPQTTSLQDKLNSIYSPYGIRFTVQADAILKGNTSWDADGDGRLNISGSGFFSKETGEMKALRKLYQDMPGSLYDRNGYYLFIVNSAAAGVEPDEAYAVQGDMPRGKQFGYLFASSTENTGRLAAHELGHGIFTLPHTFDVNLLGSDSKGQSANLMDYGDGMELAVWQWNVMANPAPLTWFDDDGDSKSRGDLVEKRLSQIAGTLISVGENGCAFVRIQTSTSNNSEGNYSLTGTSIDYLIGKYENEQPSFNIGLGQEKEFTIEQGIRIILEEPDKNWVLYVLNGHVEFCEAGQDYSQFKSLSEAKDNPGFLNKYKADLLRCKNGVYGYLTETLRKLQSFARNNQQVEFEYHGNAYALVNNTLQVVRLSNEDINAGNWTDTNIDTRLRYSINDNGIVRLKAFGIRNNLPLVSGKQADLKELSAHILSQTNRYLFSNNVTDLEQEAPDVVTDTFADGEKIDIKGKFLKIVSEGIGVTTTLLKTGEMEEQTYLTSEKGKSAIHAPGLVTGSVEVGAHRITDITGLVSLVYDIAVDEQVRNGLKNQFKTIKDEIGEDPKNFLPVLVDVMVTVTTNRTPEEIRSIFDKNADTGQRTHLAVSSTGGAVLTVMAGAAIIKDLPEIAEKLTENIRKIKRLGNSLSEFASKTIPEKLEDISNIWKTKYPAWEMMEGRTFFEDVMGEYRYAKADGWAHTADIAENFKGVDFYHNSTVKGNDIIAETAVSMKTTRVTSVDDWLKANKSNIDVLEKSMGNGADKGIQWSGKKLFYNKAELHVYVPKENLTPQFKSEWINKLSKYNPNVKYEIEILENFVQ